jgi:hypothetical protein
MLTFWANTSSPKVAKATSVNVAYCLLKKDPKREAGEMEDLNNSSS